MKTTRALLGFLNITLALVGRISGSWILSLLAVSTITSLPVTSSGAPNFQTPASLVSYAWLQQYGLLTDGLADHVDSHGDGMINWQEWIAGADPTNSSSPAGCWLPLVRRQLGNEIGHLFRDAMTLVKPTLSSSCLNRGSSCRPSQ
jgi:hypothetical protein